MEQQTPTPAPALPGSAVKVARTFKRADGVDVAVLAGHLVKFSTHKDPDLTGDFFTSDTDFGTLSRKGRAEVPGYYQHGFDPHFKGEAIGDADLTLDEFGVWAEYQIELRTDYERHLVEMAGKGLLGQSSGAVGHLVEYEQVGGSYRIKRWPIGEASLTPTPAEPRTSAAPVKSAFRAWAEAQTAPEPEPATDTTKTVPPDTTMEQQTPAPEAPQADAPEAEVKTAPAIVAPTAAEIKAIVADAIKADREDRRPAPTAAKNVEAPAVLKGARGDTEANALGAWIKTGDVGGVSHMVDDKGHLALKASNATDMNIGTAADGGNAVPTGHFNGIIAKRDESMLAASLGVRAIPGVGTSVDVPVDNEADGEFVSTAEAAAYDLDAPALSKVTFTLAKYTKEVRLSEELLQDEESRLLPFVEDFVGRGMAKTHNDLLITEVETNGTALKTFAATGAIADGELEDILFNDDLSFYLDDTGSVAWVMKPSTHGAIIQIDGNDRKYAPQVQGDFQTLLGAPVRYSNKCEAITTSGKSVLFGNWNFVGRYEAPTLTVRRDPYSLAASGQVRLFYGFRVDYNVLQAEAIGYGAQAGA